MGNRDFKIHELASHFHQQDSGESDSIQHTAVARKNL